MQTASRLPYFFCIMGIREAAHGLQTTKNPNPKRFFPDLGIHDSNGSSHKEHLDKNAPGPAMLQRRKPHPFQAPQKTGLLEIKKPAS